jgi:voltage-dependent calcium channel L type alpha-1D
LDRVNSFFSVVFIVELILKLLGLGFRHYFQDPFNGFDCFIVTTSFADLIISNIGVETNINALTALRTFRLIRLFKLARTWKQFQLLLQTMFQTLMDIASFTVLLFLFMFIYAILGMEIFAEKAKFTDDKIDMENGVSID